MKKRIESVAAEALAAAAGNMPVAEAKLIRQLLHDQQLLVEAVAPYLRPIALQLLERAQRPAGAKMGKVAIKAAGEPHLSLRAMAEAPGYNPMQAEKSGPRTAASSRHVQNIQMLAAAYRSKPSRDKV